MFHCACGGYWSTKDGKTHTCMRCGKITAFGVPIMAERPVGKELVNRIKEIRSAVPVSLKDARYILEQSDWDTEKAIQCIRNKNVDRPFKPSKEGQIFVYAHHTGKRGSIVELRCETDFAARSDTFQELGKNLCLHFCAVGGHYETGEDGDGGNMSSAMEHDWVKDPMISIHALIRKVSESLKEHVWIKRAQTWHLADRESSFSR